MSSDHDDNKKRNRSPSFDDEDEEEDVMVWSSSLGTPPPDAVALFPSLYPSHSLPPSASSSSCSSCSSSVSPSSVSVSVSSSVLDSASSSSSFSFSSSSCSSLFVSSSTLVVSSSPSSPSSSSSSHVAAPSRFIDAFAQPVTKKRKTSQPKPQHVAVGAMDRFLTRVHVVDAPAPAPAQATVPVPVDAPVPVPVPVPVPSQVAVAVVATASRARAPSRSRSTSHDVGVTSSTATSTATATSANVVVGAGSIHHFFTRSTPTPASAPVPVPVPVPVDAPVLVPSHAAISTSTTSTSTTKITSRQRARRRRAHVKRQQKAATVVTSSPPSASTSPPATSTASTTSTETTIATATATATATVDGPTASKKRRVDSRTPEDEKDICPTLTADPTPEQLMDPSYRHHAIMRLGLIKRGKSQKKCPTQPTIPQPTMYRILKTDEEKEAAAKKCAHHVRADFIPSDYYYRLWVMVDGKPVMRQWTPHYSKSQKKYRNHWYNYKKKYADVQQRSADLRIQMWHSDDAIGCNHTLADCCSSCRAYASTSSSSSSTTVCPFYEAAKALSQKCPTFPPPIIMEHNHRFNDPDTGDVLKEFNICDAIAHGYSVKRIACELSFTEPLCIQHHAHITYKKPYGDSHYQSDLAQQKLHWLLKHIKDNKLSCNGPGGDSGIDECVVRAGWISHSHLGMYDAKNDLITPTSIPAMIHVDWDHKDPSTKTAIISDMIKQSDVSLEEMQHEVAKCRMLCCSCHHAHTTLFQQHAHLNNKTKLQPFRQHTIATSTSTSTSTPKPTTTTTSPTSTSTSSPAQFATSTEMKVAVSASYVSSSSSSAVVAPAYVPMKPWSQLKQDALTLLSKLPRHKQLAAVTATHSADRINQHLTSPNDTHFSKLQHYVDSIPHADTDTQTDEEED